MQLLIEGKRDAEIAEILGVKRRTVTRRIWMVCNRLGALTRSQAVAMFVRSQSGE